MISCKMWKTLAHMFFGLVLAESFYVGVKFGCWLGVIACSIGFVSGLIYGKFKKNSCRVLRGE